MFFDDITALAIGRSLSAGLPFTAFVRPGENRAVFFSDPGEGYGPAGELTFAVNVWCGGSADEYLIADRADAEATVRWLERSGAAAPVVSPWSRSTSHSDYIDAVDELIGRLMDCGGKTVMSRTISGSCEVDWISVAEQYFAAHPEAFRYIYLTPRHGCWLGASPELLLKTSDGRFTTMALAGTRSVSEEGNAWSGKNIAEQAIVRDYIVDRLYDLGLNPVAGPTETVTTGNIQHLRTMIEGRTEGIDASEILRTLNPTPALAGYPLPVALENIVGLEQHPRRCYGSYVSVGSGSSTEAYVNLRCVNFDSRSWCMYVGGGIMPDSDSADEWLETEAKSKILSQLIAANQKNEK